MAGTAITYIPGNHDEMFRPGCRWGWTSPAFELRQEAVRDTTADGRRLLVLHGDEFDSVVRYAKFLALLGRQRLHGGAGGQPPLQLGAIRRRWAYPYWSLSAWLKRRVKEAVKAIDRFETALANEARRRGFDGVVCGHIHHAEMREVGGVLYLNDGDWVESCTALVEHKDGRLELIDWAALNKPLLRIAPRSGAWVHRTCLSRGTSRHSAILIVSDAWHAAGERRGAHAGDRGA